MSHGESLPVSIRWVLLYIVVVEGDTGIWNSYCTRSHWHKVRQVAPHRWADMTDYSHRSLTYTHMKDKENVLSAIYTYFWITYWKISTLRTL